MKLLETKTLTSGATAVTFSGLNTTKPLRCVLSLSNSSTVARLSCYVNGHTTDTDYYTQAITAYTSTVSPNRSNHAGISALQYGTFVVAEMRIVDGQFIVSTSGSRRYTSYATDYSTTYVGGSVSAITSLTFTTTEDFLSGSKISLYEYIDNAEESSASTAILDTLGVSVSSAWSMRRLTYAYSGPLFEITRAYDSATQDIYPLFNGEPDWATMGQFVGSDNMVYSKWYDQFSINDLAGTNIAGATSGVFSTRNGIPAPTYGSSSAMTGIIQANIPKLAQPRTISMVFANPTAFNNEHIFAYGASGVAEKELNFSVHSWFGTKGFSVDTNSFSSALLTVSAFNTGNSRLIWSYPGATAISTAASTVDNVAPTTSNGADIPKTSGWPGKNIAVGGNLAGSNKFTGTIPEIIVFSEEMSSAEMTTLDSDQSNYFGS